MVSKFFKKISKKKGLSPGSLVMVGEEKKYSVEAKVFLYNEKVLEEADIKALEEKYPFKEDKKIAWLNLNGIHDLELIKRTGDIFNLDPLLLEDAVNTDHRPKYEVFDCYSFIVIKNFLYNSNLDEVEAEHIALVLGRDYVISFQEKRTNVFDPVISRLKKGIGRMRKMGPDYLKYVLLDTIVDNYFSVSERIGDQLEKLEDELIDQATEDTLKKIYKMKKEILFIVRSVSPLRDVLRLLQREESGLISKKTLPFLRDAFDHIIHIVDNFETFREILNGMHEMYLSNASNKMNEVMRTLTVIATIFIPLTFLAGIYGMNFEYMPELHWRMAYPVLLLVMGGVLVTMLAYFKKKSWF